jgi:hypothetical protein
MRTWPWVDLIGLGGRPMNSGQSILSGPQTLGVALNSEVVFVGGVSGPAFAGIRPSY